MTLKNKILLTIGTLITITALTIIYVASRAISKSNIAHAYSVLSINNENIYSDMKSKIDLIKNYSISALYNKQNGLNILSPTEDTRLKFINNLVIKDNEGKEVISFPNNIKNPCADQSTNSEITFFYRPSVGDNSLCLACPAYVDGKLYISIVNLSFSFFNRRTLSAPSIITDTKNMEIALTEKTLPAYGNFTKTVVDNPDIIKEQASFIKTGKNFVLLQDVPKTNIKLISYNELAIISSSYDQFIISSLGTMLLILMVSMIVFYIMVSSFLRPIRNLCAASKYIADGEYDHKIESTNFKEINELVSSFNTMIKKIKDREKELYNLNENLGKEVDKKSNELVHAAKMASLGTLSSGIAHEFNNILGAVIGHVSLALEKKDPKEMAASLEVALMASERACGIVSRLQDFAKNKGENFSRVNVNDAINNVIRLIQKDFINNNIRIKTILQPDMFIMGDQPQIEQVVLNLLINSKQAMPKGGTIEITTTVYNMNVLLVVNDTGSGIKEEIKTRIFEPFFTTKGVVGMGKDYGAQDTEGTGLGLSVSHGIIENHNGTIKLLKSSSKGTTFEIKIPVAK